MLPPPNPPPSSLRRDAGHSPPVLAAQGSSRSAAAVTRMDGSSASGGFHPADAGPGTEAGGEEGEVVYTDKVWVERGMFAGRWMRFSLQVAQQPIHGRRKTEKDRRPLTHCPIVRLRARECRRSRDGDQWQEEEVDMASIEPAFLVCAAEVRSPESPLPYSDADSAHEGGPSVPSPRKSALDGDGDISMATPASGGYRERPGWATAPSTAPTSRPGSSSGGQRLTIPQEAPDERTPLAAPLPRIRTRNEPDELSEGSSGDEGSGRSLHGEGPDSKRHRPNSEGARNLYGSLHIPGVRVVAPEGGMGMWFLFTDLCVRYEGTYTLRFRCYDLSAVPDDGESSPPLVECHSQQFVVYSPRNFPGLPHPTALAEHFARQGFKLNTRKGDRLVSSFSSSHTATPSHIPPASSSSRPDVHPIQPGSRSRQHHSQSQSHSQSSSSHPLSFSQTFSHPGQSQSQPQSNSSRLSSTDTGTASGSSVATSSLSGNGASIPGRFESASSGSSGLPTLASQGSAGADRQLYSQSSDIGSVPAPAPASTSAGPYSDSRGSGIMLPPIRELPPSLPPPFPPGGPPPPRGR